jgi:hypothetical protein
LNTISDLAARLAHGPLLIQVIFWLTLLLLASTAAMYASLVVLHLRNDFEAMRLARLKRRWRPLLLQTLAGRAPATIPPLSRAEQEPMLDIWEGVRRHVAGPAAMRLDLFARRLSLDTVACGETVRIANGCRVVSGHLVEAGVPRQPLALFQYIEYLRSFLFGRMLVTTGCAARRFQRLRRAASRYRRARGAIVPIPWARTWS